MVEIGDLVKHTRREMEMGIVKDVSYYSHFDSSEVMYVAKVLWLTGQRSGEVKAVDIEFLEKWRTT